MNAYVGSPLYFADPTVTDIAAFRNNAVRGKSLGSAYTPAQKKAVRDGTFEGIYLGDYWQIGGFNWRIWGFDYFRGIGEDDKVCTAHHLVIVPDTNLLNGDGSTTHYMNDTNTTAGGYKAAKMRSVYLPQLLEMIENLFGREHVLKHQEMITNAVSNGKASGSEWIETKLELLSEKMVYGTPTWGEAEYNSGHNVGSNLAQLPLAESMPQFTTIRKDYWLRDVVSASAFAYVSSNGLAHTYGASYAYPGVRPFFLLS